ncbi:MAG: YceI family protein [Sciscionella sp.]
MTAPAIPGYVAGTWDIDPVHSSVNFTVRHLGVTKVRGRFNTVSGQIITGPTLADSSVTATIESDSVDTKHDQRDGHVKSPDFLDTATHTSLNFRSTGVREDAGEYFIDGELTLRGVSKPVTLNAEVGGFGPGMSEGATVIGVSATTEISRGEFGVGENIPAAVVSDKIKIELDIEAILQA